MVFLGLDASSNITGWSIIEANNKDEATLVAFGEIQLFKYKKKSNPLQYIKVLYDSLTLILAKYNPQVCYIEDIYAMNKLTYKSLSRIRGVCEIACLNAGIQNIFAINSSSARKTVLGEGKGGTKSSAICTILEDRYGMPLATKGFDQCDSILIGICGAKVYAYGKTSNN
jgi:Holliday junction resolvasome RuvABC endonuclease subunit